MDSCLFGFKNDLNYETSKHQNLDVLSDRISTNNRKVRGLRRCHCYDIDSNDVRNFWKGSANGVQAFLRDRSWEELLRTGSREVSSVFPSRAEKTLPYRFVFQGSSPVDHCTVKKIIVPTHDFRREYRCSVFTGRRRLRDFNNWKLKHRGSEWEENDNAT